ncbi:MAG: hypothetical protein HYZ13_03010 [Acidobacteria bacterium]|nr:hypothetical protein [Acidobacteriota bacterium]
MRIELLIFEGCPNREPARVLFQEAMAALGIAGEVQEIQVDSLDKARALRFPGSPTLRVDGEDVAPLPESFEPALGCRSYVVQGRRQGLPDPAQVFSALRSAQDAEAHSCCTPLAKPKAASACPACGTEGKPVKPVTLRALLQSHLQGAVRDEVYRFCAHPDCALVYFSAGGDQTFARADLTVRVGVKERSEPRPLCYCFGHSAESMREEWSRTGKSTVLEAIKAEVKAGTCHCEVTNPGGGCCLGDITKAVKALTTEPASPVPAHDCCPPQGPQTGACPTNPLDLSPKAGRRTALSAVLLGVVASACCWLPLALAGLGVATGTLGARIAWIRPWAFGALAVLMVGVIGWWALKRYGGPGEKDNCCTESPRFPKLPVVILSLSFLGAAAAPSLLHPGRNTPLTAVAPPARSGGMLVVLSTPQFDCPPCVGTLPQTLAKTPGVASVQMDFDKRETRIAFQPGTAVDAALARWKRELGFEGKEVRREPMATDGTTAVQ